MPKHSTGHIVCRYARQKNNNFNLTFIGICQTPKIKEKSNLTEKNCCKLVIAHTSLEPIVKKIVKAAYFAFIGILKVGRIPLKRQKN